MAEKGYVETSVADVLRRARVSRETFYQQFSSKQDCFVAAFETAASVILARTQRAAIERGTAGERFESALGAYLDALASEPGPKVSASRAKRWSPRSVRWSPPASPPAMPTGCANFASRWSDWSTAS